jgi:hypothetical protein
MPLVVDYLRRRRARHRLSGDPWGRAACNRVFLSVAVYLAWVYLFRHERSTLEFFIKRVMPFPLVALAIWGIYYGALGLRHDRHWARAAIGITMNAVCLFFHGIVMYWQTLELVYAYVYTGGKIVIEYR